MFYHVTHGWSKRTVKANKADKARLVREGKSHGVLLYDAGEPIAWCQFGPREELPRVDRVKDYTPPKIDAWRLTCFFVDRRYRHRGILSAVLAAALGALRRRGVKHVEAYPVDIGEKRYSASDLWWGTLRTFEQLGFSRVRRLGKNQWIVRRQLQPLARMPVGRRSRA
jgi:GNAT superfamily N-acetyltransferase